MVDEHKHVDPELEALKEWWGKYGTSVLIAVIVALGVYVGLTTWQRHQEGQAVAAAEDWQPIEAALIAEDYETGTKLATELRSNHPKSPYAVQAALWQAKLALTNGELKDAETHLGWALENSEETELRHVVRLRLARLQADQGSFDSALSTLTSGDELGSFSPAFAEVRGDVLLAKGDKEGARGAYLEAMASIGPGQGDRNLLQLKLDDLAEPDLSKPDVAGPDSGEAGA